MVWIAGGSALLAVLALALFWALPHYLDSQRQEAGAPTEPASAGRAEGAAPTTVSRSEIERQKAKRQAEASLQRVLAAQAKLLEAGVEQWAPADFEAALETLAEGDTLFSEGAYARALAAYEAVERAFAALEASRPERLDRALRRGAAALAANEVETAIEHYRIAAALAPDNQEAARGLERAQKREEVLAHMREGRAHHERGELEAAREAFAAAVELDQAYEPAQQALRAVRRAITDRGFEQAMSAVFRALDAGQFDAAAQALSQARAIKPGADALSVAARRLETEREQARLAALREQAAEQVAAEEWAAAVESYRAALRIDPNVAFAVQGLPRAYRRAELDSAFRRYLEDPTRLYADEPLARAEELLETAAQIDDPGEKLQSQIERLRGLVAEAKEPVPVTLVSDGKTQVGIFKVGELGTFEERTLRLRPGDYVAVGSRRGYRDVRREFTVRPGEPPEPVVVICREMV